MVYSDGIHLVGNTLEELHEFAEKIGLKRHFYHGYHKGHPHYDLTNKAIRKKAFACKAVYISTREIVKGFQDGRFNKIYQK